MANLQNNKLAAVGLIVLGLFFLITQIFNISWIGVIWPFFVILPGLPFLYAATNSEDEDSAGLIFPGIIVTGTGLLLLYQSITGHWESWAYAWSLYPVMVGMALQFNGRRTRNNDEVNTGKGMVTYGLMAFVGLAFLFEFLIFGSIFSGFTGILITMGLLGGGLYLLTKKDDGDSLGSNLRATLGGNCEPEKRKNDLRDVDHLAEKPKHKYDPSPEINADLRRKIDAALAEDNRENGA